jgi:hypothetical protein
MGDPVPDLVEGRQPLGRKSVDIHLTFPLNDRFEPGRPQQR